MDLFTENKTVPELLDPCQLRRFEVPNSGGEKTTENDHWVLVLVVAPDDWEP